MKETLKQVKNIDGKPNDQECEYAAQHQHQLELMQLNQFVAFSSNNTGYLGVSVAFNSRSCK